MSSFSEYIVDGTPLALFQVKQFLMTLPQQLEPFTVQDNSSVLVTLKHGKLQGLSQNL